LSATILPIGTSLLFSGFLGQIDYTLRTFHRDYLFQVCDGEDSFMKERWLSVEQIATHLGVNPGTIYKWIGRKKMPAHKVGRLWKFLASEVDQWVKAGKAGQKRPKMKTPKNHPKA
jgi:excisionase family DNA binding protein